MAIETHHLNSNAVEYGIVEYWKQESQKNLADVQRLMARVADLEKLNHDLCERVTDNDEIRLHWEEIEQTKAENERMKARIAELEEDRRWRKFSEEKPERNQWILVFYPDHSQFKTGVEVARWDNGLNFDVVYDVYTHWMPLPSAPKEEK